MRSVACDAARLPFLDGSLEFVICSEVLEHIEDDELVLEEMGRVIKRGGELLLTCPIHQKYFGFDDQFVGHYRRYEVPELIRRLSRLGFGEFQLHPILGPLEKFVMEKSTRFFSLIKKRGEESRHLGFVIRTLVRLIFPVYVFFNVLLAFCAYAQAQIVPLEKVVTIFIRCRKLA